MLRRWFFPTILVILALGVLVRLGIWQLDRLAQRRASNARILAQVQSPPLDLNASPDADLSAMEYRPVTLSGEFDFAHEVALRNQAYHNNLGAHLLTPLHLQGQDGTVLVDRGWIPQEEFLSGDWSKFSSPGGVVTLQGVIRLPQAKPDFGHINDALPAPGEAPLRAWNLANVAAIAQQLPYPLFPVYVQQTPDPSAPPPPFVQPGQTVPYPSEPDVDLSEGSHQSYALQWFTFALILAVGYPLFVRRQEQRRLEGPERPTP